MKIVLQNKKKSTILTVIVFSILFIIGAVPVIFLIFSSNSLVYNLMIDYQYLVWVVVVLFIYFMSTGIYYYKIIFEDSSFLIRSSRTISGFFGGKNYKLEISNDMIIGFRFFSRKVSFNDILLIQIKSSSGRKSAVRIPLTLVSKGKRDRMSNILNNIIQKNECQTN